MKKKAKEIYKRLNKLKKDSLGTDYKTDMAPMLKDVESRVQKLTETLKKSLRDTALSTEPQTESSIRQALAATNYERELDGIIKVLAKNLPKGADKYYLKSLEKIGKAYDETLPGFIDVKAIKKGKAPKVVFDKPINKYLRETRAKYASRIDEIIGKATQPAPEGAKGAFLDTINKEIDGMGNSLYKTSEGATEVVFTNTYAKAEGKFGDDFKLGEGVRVKIIPTERAEILDYLKQIDSRADALPEDSALDTIADWNKRINGGSLEDYFTEQVTTDSYQWISVLQDNSGELDVALHEKIFKYGEGPLPPLHPNCKCRIVPVINEAAYK